MDWAGSPDLFPNRALLPRLTLDTCPDVVSFLVGIVIIPGDLFLALGEVVVQLTGVEESGAVPESQGGPPAGSKGG